MKFIAVASEFMTEQEIATIVEENRDLLGQKGYEQISEEDRSEADNLAYFVITGGTEKQILQYEAFRAETEETVLIAYPKNNSLAACLEVLARLNQLGKPGRIDLLSKKNLPLIKKTNEPFQADLKGARVGVIGKPSDWLVASSHSADIVKDSCKAELVEISINEFIGLYLSMNDPTDKIVEDLAENATEILEPSTDDLNKNARVYLALKELVEKYKLEALTIRCFDIVKALNTTGCFALSQLNDEGIIAGCEGDITAVLGMMISYKKTGKIPWMANPVSFDTIENSLELAHCTVPRKLVESYRLRSHFETNIGVGIQGFFPIGQKVRLWRMGGEDLNMMWQAEGELFATGCEETQCRTQIKVKLFNKQVAELLNNPLGNHLVVELL